MQERIVLGLAQEEAQRPFDLEKGALLRTSLVRVRPNRHALFLTLHHIVTDGWSLGVLVQEFTALYQAFHSGRQSPLPELKVQYADFARWQRSWLDGKVLESQLEYWRNKLANMTRLELQPDFQSPANPTRQGMILPFTIPAVLSEKMGAFARRGGVTLFMLLAAAFKVLLSRYARQEDVGIGILVANRNRTETEKLVGFFANTLVLRTFARGDLSFRDFLGQVRTATLEAQSHQDLPFGRLVEELEPARDAVRTPLFQGLFALQNANASQLAIPGLELNAIIASSVRTAKFDWAVALYDTEPALTGDLEYRTELFLPDTMSRLLDHFRVLLAQVVDDPERRLYDLSLLTEAESRELIAVARGESQEYTLPALHQYIEQQAETTPNAVAVSCDEYRFTYQELNRRANQLAWHLVWLGVQREQRCAVYLERDSQLLVALLAILKAGAAYVPLDPLYPRERLEFMLQDSGAVVFITNSKLRSQWDGGNRPIVLLDRDLAIADQHSPNPDCAIFDHQLAYVIYTSGSTGRPKGVMIEHGGMRNHVLAKVQELRLTAADKVAETASASFDISIWQYLAALVAGGAVRVFSGEVTMNGLQLLQEAEHQGVTVIETVPTVLAGMLEEEGPPLSRVRLMISNAEPLPVSLCDRWNQKYAHVSLLNAYGPTECSDDVTHWTVREPASTAMPWAFLGYPLSNTELFVFDHAGHLAPIGVAGELYVGGDGVGRGYMNQPELTAERFVPHPFSTRPGARLYRTGDLVRRVQDGNLEFVQRLDTQVKIRGNRIELGEIEAVLRASAAVAQCALVQHDTSYGDQQLVAYVTLHPGKSASPADLREWLQRKLPEYMVPSAFVMLDKIPLNINGKVDRNALPLPGPKDFTGSAGYEPPRTPVEDMVAGIWGQVLNLNEIGRHQNFFELGGHSLIATQVMSRIRSNFHVELPLRALFETPTVAGLSARLEQDLRERHFVETPPITPVSRDRDLPLSFAQQRLWFIDQLEPGVGAYNMPYAVSVTGKFDHAAMQKSFDEVVRRHEGMRTRFSYQDRSPVQQIDPATSIAISIVDLQAMPHSRAIAERVIGEEAVRPFDLKTGPLVRFLAMQLDAEEHVLMLTLHHIVSDGWSMRILIREFTTLYAAYTSGEPSPLEGLLLQYADYAVWQRQWLQGEVLERQLSYWKQQLAGLQPLDLLTDSPRPMAARHHAGAESLRLSRELSDELRQFSRQSMASTFMTLLAAFKVLLYRYTGQTDLAVGSPIANRNQREIESLIGFFVNMLPLRTQLTENPSFHALLQRVKDTCLHAYAHQDLPFEKLVEELHPERGLTRSPLVQITFVLEDVIADPVQVPELVLEPLLKDAPMVRFDIECTIRRVDEQFEIRMLYDADLFKPARIRRMMEHYAGLLASAMANPQENISSLQLLPEAELQRVVRDWNATETEFPKQQCVHELFGKQVENTPYATAVVSEDVTLSYAELNRQANQLAHHLLELGVTAGERVATILERSVDLVIAELAILKCGAAYVPIDPRFPAERKALLISDSNVRVVIAPDKAQLADLPEVAQVNVHSHTGRLTRNPDVPLTSEAVAYVMYTSGSMGKAKGVMVPHRAITRLVLNNRYASFELGDRLAFAANPAFDAATMEVWAPLLNGGAIVIIDDATLLNPVRFEQKLKEDAVSVLWLTVGLFNQYADLLKEAIAGLRYLIVGGDALDPRVVARVLRNGPPRCLLNGYGPTETTTFAATFEITSVAASARSIPIGRPIANTQVYILDVYGQPAPIEIAGEIYIGGAGVALGYNGRPELTAERFVPNPFAGAGERMYRTGDIGRWLEDGIIEFMGRNDSQVKIRGYRIEPGEIEVLLAEHPEVREAVVITREDTEGEKRLVAYYTSRNPGAGTEMVNVLRTYVASRLPEYMVPAAYVHLEALPLTANGKLDFRMLPSPEADAYAARGYEPPIGEVEGTLGGLWAEVLNLDRVGRHDNFFELGGHSLLALTLIQRMREVGLESDVRTLFETPSLADFASSVGRRNMNIEVAANRIPAGCVSIVPEMLPLVKLSQQEIDGIVQTVDGGAGNIEDIYPLAPLQEGILFHYLMEKEGDPYLTSSLLAFDGKQRLAAYLRALQALIDRHDILRTAVIWEGLHEPVQVVWRKVVLATKELDLDPGAKDAAGQMFTRLNPRQQRIDFRKPPLLGIHVAYDQIHDRWLMMQLVHQMIGDHRTMALMQQEMQAHLEGEGDQLPQALPFRNLVVQARLGVSQEEHESHFRQLLGDVTEPTAPFGLLNVWGDGTSIAEAEVALDGDIARRIRIHASRLGVNSASLFHVVWAVVLSRVSVRDDVIFGTVLFGRTQTGEGSDRGAGLFINTLPVRMSVKEESIEASIRGMHRQLVELMRHEHAPLALAQRCSAVPVSMPLFSALLNYRHNALTRQAEPSAAWEGIRSLREEERTNYPFVLSVNDSGDGFRLTAQVQTPVIPERVCNYVQTALESLAGALETSSATQVSALEIIPAWERQQILYEWNATAVANTDEPYIHQLFERQVERTPDAVAIVFEETCLTYEELNRQANQWAHHLTRLGAKPDTRVAICVERGLEMMIGLLAVLKAGAAYVPLDPQYPRERLDYMLADSNPLLLLTKKRLLEEVPKSGIPVLAFDSPEEGRIDSYPVHNPEVKIADQNLAYVIYTSGSTGRPKGAMNTHGGIRNRLLWMQDRYQLDQTDLVLQKTPISFDVSVWEFFWPLLAGAKLVMARPGGHQESSYLVELIQQQAITTLHFVPSMLQIFTEERNVESCMSIKRVFCSGESLLPELKNKFFNLLNCQLHNLYGPTEAAVDVTYWECESRCAQEMIPIGRPIANSQIYVLDGKLSPVPLGGTGELYIGGDGLARGYWNQPAWTAERFVPDPFAQNPGSRLYRTGDLGRLRIDGAIEYLGRTDHQVKIRGFRIELGEIEATLVKNDSVKEAAVIVHQEKTGDKCLVAYIVPDGKWVPSGPNLYQLPNGLAVLQQNKGETDYLYDEIFVRESYLGGGIELPEDACVFDVGANIGLFSLFVGERCPRGRIYAFEPIAPVYEKLVKNVGQCGAKVTCFATGLGQEDGPAEFLYYPRHSMMSALATYADKESAATALEQYLKNRRDETGDDPEQAYAILAGRLEGERHRCWLQSLSTVICQENIERIDLLKVDVEGAELEVLNGLNESDWSKVWQVVVESHGSTDRLQVVTDILKRHGFQVEVAQEKLLRGTGMYNIFARRPGARQRRQAKTERAPAMTVERLREDLKKQLPHYMVPAFFVLLQQMPLSPNGKVDRRKLPAPERSGIGGPYKAPRTELEKVIAAVFTEVLNVKSVGMQDNFFELGGHSLLLMQMMSRIRSACNAEVPFRKFYESPTVAGLAREVEQFRQKHGAAQLPAIMPVSHDQDLSLSFAQEQLWFLDQLQPGSSAYNLPFAVRLQGRLKFDALKQSLNDIIARHEVLRTVFAESQGRPFQRIIPQLRLDIEETDIRAMGELEQEVEVQRQLQMEVDLPFDLRCGPLLRAKLLRLGERDYVFLLTMHHVVSDGWSMSIMVRELSRFYEGHVREKQPGLQDLAIQYADFAVWQRQWLQGDVLEKQVAYWQKKLAGATKLELPASRSWNTVASEQAGRVGFELSRDLTSALKEVGRREGATLFMVLLACWQLVLARYTGQEDIAVATATANRTRIELEQLIGFFVNILILRTHVRENLTFRGLLSMVRQTVLEAYDHQDVPFENVMERIAPDMGADYQALFQVMLILQNTPSEELNADSSLRILPIEDSKLVLYAKRDLTLYVWDNDGALTGSAIYRSQRFEESNISGLLESFKAALAAAAAEGGALQLFTIPWTEELQQNKAVEDFTEDLEPQAKPRT
jgi:amino acid adenylation domain-containing protein/FkbM family methyltransferase